ncbi:Na+/H+ antiporter NhaA [Panacibacter ginsenosidivorans]|uniref:Na(+)/H(+) antiporter NhaA n=1 Tax=Panacibacter ginsenosidivorans TaxID=1813871 RepID=A0A5B8VA55_9BACT|nr:Na+/H+ antiporter NhaA [Panacibacter ginsenosidivorans]QEC67576.1 Na+/H+ antiporter NhaA [Panacibacter ginsenosidivorans]
MHRKVLSIAHHHVITPIREFLQDSRSVGIILIAFTIISLFLSNNSFTSEAYISFFHTSVTITAGSVNLPESPLSWINDVLMTLFFFLVAMEIKRELTIGELASIKKSLLPVLAAFGGMVCPAIIYTFFNGNTDYHHGWGIPMATDIAFSLGVLSLLGKKVPVQLKIFLAALAIIDDLGAVVTIAVFYTSKIQLIYLLGAIGSIGMVLLFNYLKLQRIFLYIIPGVALWYCLFNSGVHPTIAGVMMAFSMPLSKLEKLERILHFPVNFIIMPLFALANTAILLPSDFSNVFDSSVSYGVMLGLIIGKPVGIFLFSYIATKAGIASLPSNTNYKQLWGIGMLGGIGFTMSIFTSTLAFSVESLQVISKVSIIGATLISSVIGYAYLKLLKAAPLKSKYAEDASIVESLDNLALELNPTISMAE